MIPQTQRRVGKRGRCFNACLAAILEIPEHAVPDFDVKRFSYASQRNGVDDYWANVEAWLAARGLAYKRVPITAVPPVGYGTIEGVSPRGGQHACVALNGKLIFDPHPQDGTGRGLTEPQYYGVLIPAEQTKPHDYVPSKAGPGIDKDMCLTCGTGYNSTPHTAGRATDRMTKLFLRRGSALVPYKPGDAIKLPNGKRTKVASVQEGENLFHEPERHVWTTTGEVLTIAKTKAKDSAYSNPYYQLKPGDVAQIQYTIADYRSALAMAEREKPRMEQTARRIAEFQREIKEWEALLNRITAKDRTRLHRALDWALDAAPVEATRTFTVSGNADVLARIDKMLAYISWCSGVGHSCTVGMDLDGDGFDRIKVEGTVTKVNEDDVETRDRPYEQLK